MQEERQAPKYKYWCTDCGYTFNNPKRGPSTSLAGMFGESQGGYSLFCPRCGRERTCDSNGNPTIFQDMRDFFGL